MDFQEYQKAASRTLECDMTPLELICNLGFGLTGEAGEISDLLKKVLFHKHPLDIDELKEELGDQLWYLFMIGEYYGINMNEVAQKNIEKLAKRYPNGFNYKDSQERRDTTNPVCND